MFRRLQSIKKKAATIKQSVLKRIDTHPLLSFFGFLGLLLLLVIVGSFLQKKAPLTESAAAEPKQVETYSFGENPKMAFTARVEKSGVITIFAQAPGIVQKISLTEGQKVSAGQSVVSLSTNYQGGNVASLGRQIAQKSFDSAVQNYDLQKDIIKNQRDLAEKANTLASDMRDISRQSITDTQNLVSLNQNIIDSIDAQITNLENTNVNGSNDAAILGAKQGKAAATAGLLNLNTALKTTQYQTKDSTISAQISDTTRDVTQKQLDLQEKGLALSKDLSELNLKLARVSEGLMYPASPVSGIVERVYVRVGQSILPGTQIATIKANKGQNTAVVLVPRSVALQISKTDSSDFLIEGEKISVLPRAISTEATDGNLYSVVYTLPTEIDSKLTDKSSVQVNIALGTKKIVVDNLYVPLDSIYQTQDKAYIYIVEDNDGKSQAHVSEVTLGDVSGSFVRVTKGLTSADTVIVSRNVQEGDVVKKL